MLTTEWGRVGTRGGCGAGWGQGDPVGTAWSKQVRTPTRTSTRPPHPLHPAPCPYRTLGRKHLNGDDSPIRLSKIHQALDHDGPIFCYLETNLLVETCRDPHQKDHHKARGSRGRFCDRGIVVRNVYPYVRTYQPLRENDALAFSGLMAIFCGVGIDIL